MTPDPIARALACVDAEADKRAAEMEYDTSKGAVGSTAAIGIGQVHAKLVYRAHLERALRALWPFANWAQDWPPGFTDVRRLEKEDAHTAHLGDLRAAAAFFLPEGSRETGGVRPLTGPGSDVGAWRDD